MTTLSLVERTHEIAERIVDDFKNRLLDAPAQVALAVEISNALTTERCRLSAPIAGMELETAEEQVCSCGAGYGSGEPHMDWCSWTHAVPYLDRLGARLGECHAGYETLKRELAAEKERGDAHFKTGIEAVTNWEATEARAERAEAVLKDADRLIYRYSKYPLSIRPEDADAYLAHEARRRPLPEPEP